MPPVGGEFKGLQEKDEDEEERALMIYIADQHVGAKTLEDSLYLNEYNEEEFNNRMNATVQKIEDLYKKMKSEKKELIKESEDRGTPSLLDEENIISE